MIKLTENEIKALQVCIDKTCDLEMMLDDKGRVMAGLPEMMDELGWNRHKAAGVIGSLEAKDMGESDEDDRDGGEHIFWPSDEGYRAAYAALN